jgi:arylsulfatase
MAKRVSRDLVALAAVLLPELLFAPGGVRAADAPRPNIVVILADDMGFSDIGCYGSEIPTPNLDRLAADGLRFTQFYNTARCCPSRAALLTGLYPHQAGIGHMVQDLGLIGYRGRLNDRCVTIAEVLHGAGYFTAMTGKWHVGQNFGVVPWKRGFQRSLDAPEGRFYYPEAAGAGVMLDGKRYAVGAELYLDGRRLAADDPALPAGWYSTDLWTDYGIRFVDEALAAGKPFFLYLAHNAPHFPLQAPQEEIARFRGRYKVGWDQLRRDRHARQIEQGIVERAWRLSPRPPPVRAWESLSPGEQDRFDHIMAIYAAVVAHLDRSVGRFVDALRQRGVLDDTLILFLSDNGANAESGPAGRLEGALPGSARSVVFQGQSWATLSNTPLRRYKHFNHEGGIATPLIVHWPRRIKTPGELRKQPGHVVDIMATCVEVAGAAYPAEFGGKPILPMEGTSLLPALDNRPVRRESICWEHEGNAAIRVGDWKLVRLGADGPWELYDLAADRTETADLAAARPELVRELARKWEAWAERTHVKPYPKGALLGPKAL